MISKNHLNNQKIAGNLFLFPVDWAVQLSKTRKDFKMISARNHFHGNVKEIRKGAVNGIVKLETPGGNAVSSTISLEAVKDLGLTVGAKAVAIVKSTSVMLGEE